MENEPELRIHVQTTHDNVRVNLLNEKELIRIRCEKCEQAGAEWCQAQ